jgi:hypothetical protein
MLSLKNQRTAIYVLGLHLVACDPEESGTSQAGATSDDGASAGMQTGPDETTGEVETEPDEGFRVFPKYMLQDVQAVVTMVAEGGNEAVPCPADTLQAGGYLCDTGPLFAAGGVSIWVERDGFEPAQRDAVIQALTVQVLEVHLSVEGGPT